MHVRFIRNGDPHPFQGLLQELAVFLEAILVYASRKVLSESNLRNALLCGCHGCCVTGEPVIGLGIQSGLV